MSAHAPLSPRRFWLTLVALLLVVAGATVVALLVGSAPLDWSRVTEEGSNAAAALWDQRLPRIVTGLLAGAILGISGAALQGLLRNDLAEPFILGVSGGAGLGSALATVLGLATVGELVGGFGGALLALMGVTALATRHGRVRPLDMLLIGVIFNAFAGAALLLLQALAEAATVQRILLRLMGSLSADPTQPWVSWVLLWTLVGAIIVLARTARSLDVLALGDDTARSLGVDPDRLRITLFVVLSLPIGAVVAATGMIGFIGLIVPHAVRLLAGPDHRLLLPASALGGAAVLVLADTLVRWLEPIVGTDLPVGIITALVGGPVFIALLRRSSGGR